MSRSLLGNYSLSTNTRSLFVDPSLKGSSADFNFSQDILDEYETLYTKYSQPMAEKNYYQIDTATEDYLNLLSALQSFHSSITNENLAKLVSITIHSLIGAVNISSLYEQSLASQLKISILERQVNDIVSNRNVMYTATATSDLTIGRKVVLAPIFSFYIMAYGLPDYGVGFIPDKMQRLFRIFKALNLDPYNSSKNVDILTAAATAAETNSGTTTTTTTEPADA
jgi:hypothetical protein